MSEMWWQRRKDLSSYDDDNIVRQSQDVKEEVSDAEKYLSYVSYHVIKFLITLVAAISFLIAH